MNKVFPLQVADVNIVIQTAYLRLVSCMALLSLVISHTVCHSVDVLD